MIRLVASLYVLWLFMGSGHTKAASFDCRRAATPDERAVCADPVLSDLDEQASAAFARAKGAVGTQVVGIGRRFLASRRACGMDPACIGQVYQAMIETYQGLASSAPEPRGAGLPRLVGECMTTTVVAVMPRLDFGRAPRLEDFDSGTTITFTNGGGQVSYDREGALLASRTGDPVRMCLTFVPRDCPPNDDRGRVYSSTNLRTQQSWSLPDSQHQCGGA